MRIVGLDVGERRIGVAVSDRTLTLARPVDVLHPASLDRDGAPLAAAAVAQLAAEEDGVSAIVVGMPRRLDGTPTEITPRIEAFAAELERLTGLRVIRQDERLTSREAESRLALTDKDWRSRKQRLDAAAAAVILQDFLDTRPGRPVPLAADPEL
ncbi:MAG: Holliday junction resolvase RuvX [Acidobacteria bacterium]|nr:Holliday junction resolvase RuvX [Acidobacteriota bacterium]